MAGGDSPFDLTWRESEFVGLSPGDNPALLESEIENGAVDMFHVPRMNIRCDETGEPWAGRDLWCTCEPRVRGAVVLRWTPVLSRFENLPCGSSGTAIR